jgi:hypothetical protein
VTDDEGRPIEGLTIQVFTDPCSYIAVAGGQTDGSGFYEVYKIVLK